MKPIREIIIAVLICLSWCSCTKTLYIPKEMARIEFRDRIYRDSVMLRDSITVHHKGDTVYVEKYRYLYRDKTVRDSVLRIDSIAYPVYVEKVKNVRHIPKAYRIAFAIALAVVGLGSYKVIRWLRRIMT